MRWARECISNDVGCARCVNGGDGKFGKKSELALLASGFGRCEAVEGADEGFVVGVELKSAALQMCAEM